MIQANELRIGNWVEDTAGSTYSGKRFIRVESITSKGINEWQDMGASGRAEFDKLQPIPMIPEILGKVGLPPDNIKIGGEFFLKRDGDCFILYHKDQDSGVTKYFNVCIYYIHQAQNLAFALSREELKIEL